jgi:hypothetical protein
MRFVPQCGTGPTTANIIVSVRRVEDEMRVGTRAIYFGSRTAANK